MDHGAHGRRERDAAARVESADAPLPVDIDVAAIESLATAVKAVTAAGVAFEATLTGLGWAVLEFAQRRRALAAAVAKAATSAMAAGTNGGELRPGADVGVGGARAAKSPCLAARRGSHSGARAQRASSTRPVRAPTWLRAEQPLPRGQSRAYVGLGLLPRLCSLRAARLCI